MITVTPNTEKIYFKGKITEEGIFLEKLETRQIKIKSFLKMLYG